VAGKEGVGITAALILQRTSGSIHFGIKEPFLTGISHPRIKGSASAGYFKRGQIKQDWPESKEWASAGYFKKKGRLNRTGQNQKNRPVPGITKMRGRIKRTGGSGYFQTPQPTQLGFHY
jgi:hypothetical protein